jgi:spore maturation protein CgeB
MRLFRIFLVLGGKASPGDKGRMWVKNLHDPLVALGHDVFLLDIDDYAERHGFPYMGSQVKERLSNDLPEIFSREHELKPFDMFFSYLHDGQITPGVLKEIKKKVFTINYSTNFHQFEMYKEISRIVDANIYISKVAKSGFDELNVKSYWMPLAANPAFYKPSATKNNDTVFVGSVYGPRASLFWRLLQYGVSLQLYGYGWIENFSNKGYNQSANLKLRLKTFVEKTMGYKIVRSKTSLDDAIREEYEKLNDIILSVLRRDFNNHLHSSLSDGDYVKILAEAGMVINIQESRFNHDYFNHQVLFGSNLRDYETTMCGTLLCTQYSDEVNELFEDGKEVICYHNEHDLSDKIKFFSKNITERDKVAKAGYQRSIHNHTWQKRFEDFFNHLNFEVA